MAERNDALVPTAMQDIASGGRVTASQREREREREGKKVANMESLDFSGPFGISTPELEDEPLSSNGSPVFQMGELKTKVIQ